MSGSTSIDRRGFLAAGAAAAITAPGAGGEALAQVAVDPVRAARAGYWRELAQISGDAARLGIATPRLSVGTRSAGAEGGFEALMPATLDLIDSVKSTRGLGVSADSDKVVERAQDLLQRINAEERNLAEDWPVGMSVTAKPLTPPFETVKAEYAQLFATCKVRDQHRSTVQYYVGKLEDANNRRRWYEVAREACCPWYFVAIIHALECSYNFGTHLHNGDPLKARTVLIPSGRPEKWLPPSDWESSALDALRIKSYHDQQDWSVERTCYRWEAYNGWRSRRNGINTPYLWSFSQHYSKGKFVADNVWDPNAVSKQAGCAVLLRVLVDKGFASPPA